MTSLAHSVEVLPPPCIAGSAPPGEQGMGPGREITRTCSTLQETALHLHRLRMIQAVCEERTDHPSFLTIGDVQLALGSLDRYFAPRFAERGLDLSEVRETLRWVAGEFASDQGLEDVIGTLVIRLFEEQVLARQAARAKRRAS